LQEVRHEASRPDQGQDKAEDPGHEASQHHLNELHGVFAVAVVVDAHEAKKQLDRAGLGIAAGEGLIVVGEQRRIVRQAGLQSALDADP